MKCIYCEDTRTIKVPRPEDKDKFDEFVDRELDKGYQVNRLMAERKIIKKFNYLIKECPYCKTTDNH